MYRDCVAVTSMKRDPVRITRNYEAMKKSLTIRSEPIFEKYFYAIYRNAGIGEFDKID